MKKCLLLLPIQYIGSMKTTLSFKIDESLKSTLSLLAKQENRSLSNYVVTSLMRIVEESGINGKEMKKNEASNGKTS